MIFCVRPTRRTRSLRSFHTIPEQAIRHTSKRFSCWLPFLLCVVPGICTWRTRHCKTGSLHAEPGIARLVQRNLARQYTWIRPFEVEDVASKCCRIFCLGTLLFRILFVFLTISDRDEVNYRAIKRDRLFLTASLFYRLVVHNPL